MPWAQLPHRALPLNYQTVEEAFYVDSLYHSHICIMTIQNGRGNAEAIISELFGFIEAQGDADYLGEAVSQLEHSLQAAHFAEQAGADEDTILGALLHDVGRFIPLTKPMPRMIAPNGTYVGSAAHEIVGEKYLRDLGFSEKICQLVGAHVIAKRYLTAVDETYYDGLSQSSKTTLKFQVRAQRSSAVHLY